MSKSAEPRRARVLPLLAILVLAGSTGLSQEPSAETVALGKQVFTEEAQPACASCHTLADAGSTGRVGPNLDELQPAADVVQAAVTNGVGVMPPYRDALTEEQIAAVSTYVASVAGQAR